MFGARSVHYDRIFWQSPDVGMQGTFYVKVVRKRTYSLCSFCKLQINNTFKDSKFRSCVSEKGIIVTSAIAN
jgi:hypothetical protein